MKKQLVLVLSVVMLLALVVIPASAAGFPDPGSGTTYTELANKEAVAASASITYYNTSGGTVPGTNFTIPGNGSYMIDPEDTQLVQGFEGSAVVSSNKMLASVVQTEWEGGPGDGFQMGLYSGVSAGSSAICFPSLWKYENLIISSFAVQNTGTSPVDVDLTYTGRDGVVAMVDSDTIPAGAQHPFDLATLGIPLSWAGSVKVAVNGEGSVAGVAVVTWGGANANKTRSATYNAADCSGAPVSTTLVVPTHFRYHPLGDDWTGGIWSAVNVQNLSGNTANLTLTYTDRDGGTDPLVLTSTIPPYATIGANTRNGGDFPASDFDPLDAVDLAWVGAVKIVVSESAVATVITQWDRNGINEAGVYAAADVSAGATKIFAPGVKRIKPGGWDQWSAVIVQNLGTGAADVTIDFYDRTGASLLTFSNDTIAPGAALGYNTNNGGDKDKADFYVLGDAYEGHAVVTSNNGQPLAVVLNGVSKAPDGGSATTNGVAE